MRTKGAKNITPFEKRTNVPVSDIKAIKPTDSDPTPLGQFTAAVNHQRNFLKWLQKRHDRIIELNKELVKARTGKPPKRSGAKDATHRKYFWFAQRMAFLDVVNAFEFFFKESCILLAAALSEVIPAGQISGSVDARFIWRSLDYSPARLLFEHRLFHDLKVVNKSVSMLIGKEPYPNQTDVSVRCINAIFQLRHTLSHNRGQMTQSDATKLRIQGLKASHRGVLDLGDDDFMESAFRFLESESERFTRWLAEETSARLVASAKATDKVHAKESNLSRLFSNLEPFHSVKLD